MTGRTVGLILAAGAGRRYGAPKILVPGWLDTAVAALRGGGCDEVHVVTGAARPPPAADVREIHAENWADGIGASLRTGLAYLTGRPEAGEIVIHVVDCPDIGPDVVARVLGAGPGLRRAVFDGRRGHPVVLPHAHLRPLLEEVTDENGAGPYVRRQDHEVVECGDLASGMDIDRPTPPVRHSR